MWKPALLAALVLAQPLAVPAATAAAPSLVGRWSLVAGSVSGFEQALDTIMEGVPALARGFVRPKIAEGLKPVETLAIALEGQQLVLTYGTQGPIRVALDGTPVTVKRGTELSARLDGPGALTLHTKFEHGRRETRYQLSADGQRFAYTSTLSSEKMAHPARYQASYQRAR